MVRKLIRATYSAETGLAAYSKINRLLGKRKKHILFACMPKTGSTFLKRVLSRLTGFRETVLTYALERTEQELYLPKLIDSIRHNTITRQHLRATAANLRLLRSTGIRPVVLVRDLFDVVVSIRDHLEAEGFEKFPSLYATEHLEKLGEQEQYEFLIRFALPWYFDFFVSWHDAIAANQIDALVLTYEGLSQDWASGIRQILDHQGISKPDSEISRCLDMATRSGKRSIRLNKGVVGRGHESLGPPNKERVRRMAHFYPWVDFTPVGLGGPAPEQS